MSVASICKRDVVTVGPAEDLVSAARLMRDRHVGYLVVVEASSGRSKVPVGVLTDRDIVVAVLAKDIGPGGLAAGDVMTREPLVLDEHSSLNEALGSMRENGVRRVPIVDAHGGLVGVLSIDDVIDELAGQLVSIAASIRNEQRIERKARP